MVVDVAEIGARLGVDARQLLPRRACSATSSIGPRIRWNRLSSRRSAKMWLTSLAVEEAVERVLLHFEHFFLDVARRAARSRRRCSRAPRGADNRCRASAAWAPSRAVRGARYARASEPCRTVMMWLWPTKIAVSPYSIVSPSSRRCGRRRTAGHHRRRPWAAGRRRSRLRPPADEGRSIAGANAFPRASDRRSRSRRTPISCPRNRPFHRG